MQFKIVKTVKKRKSMPIFILKKREEWGQHMQNNLWNCSH